MTSNNTAAILPDQALDQLFRKARTFSRWQPRDVPAPVLEALYELAKMGPTSANTSPMRLVFVHSPEAKAKLLPCLDAGNLEKTRTAPVTAIIIEDHDFHERLPALFPHADARSWFVGNAPLIDATARRNTALQGAYLIMAARALGLDAGPMSGFDARAVEAAFCAGQPHWRVSFLCNLGYGDPEGQHPRLPRLAFDDVCQIV